MKQTLQTSVKMAALLAASFTIGGLMLATPSTAHTVAFQQGGPRGGMRGGPGGSPYMLLNRTDVDTDLQLSQDQKDKIAAIQADMRAQFMKMRQNNSGGDPTAMRKAFQTAMAENDAKYKAILTPEQDKRLQEISLQLEGGRALLNPKVQTALGMTAEQKTQAGDLAKKQQAANRDLMTKVQNGEMDRSAAFTTMQANEKTLGDLLMKLLTADQKTKLAAMEGAPFKATDQPRGFGGGGGRRGGGAQG